MSVQAKIEKLIEQGKKDEAIAVFQGHYKCEERKARSFVEGLWREFWEQELKNDADIYEV